MTTNTTDAQLVSSYLAGDRSALAAIYDRYAPGLYDTARAMLSNSHDASDMVQDVFCLAAERLGQLRDHDRLKPWLYAVLRNEVYKRTKRRRRATPTDFQAEGTPDVPAAYDPRGAGEGVAYEELAELVRAAAAGLDERDRLVLELSIRQGLGGRDLADALGVTADQSYSLVHRMRDRVEKSLGALTVAKAGRRDCPDLDRVLEGWDGEFTVLIRKRVNRHIEDCPTCDGNRRKLAPLALFGAAPAFAMPLGLRDRVLAATAPSSGSSVARGRRQWRSDGFPTIRRGLSVWFAGSAVAMLVVGGVVAVASRGDSRPLGDDVVAPTTIADSSTTVAIESLPPLTTDVLDDATASPATLVVVPSSPNTEAPFPTPSPNGDPSSPPTTATAIVPTVAPVPTTKAPRSTTVAPSTAPSTTAPVIVRPLITSTSRLDFGTTATSLTLTISNPNAVSVAIDVSSPSGLFTITGAPANLAAGRSAVLTVAFARSSAESYAQITAFPETGFDKTLVIDASTSTSAASNAITLTGSVTRPPMVGKLAIAFSATGCTSVRVQVAVTDESALKGVTATVTVGGTPRSFSLSLVSGSTYAGTLPGLPAGAGSMAISVTATDSTGRSGSASTSTTQPTSC